MSNPDDLRARIDALRRVCDAATAGPWRYGGICGDPDKPLRHYVEAKNGSWPLMSEGFELDYAGLDKPLRFAAAARTWLPLLLDFMRGEVDAAAGMLLSDTQWTAHQFYAEGGGKSEAIARSAAALASHDAAVAALGRVAAKLDELEARDGK